MQRAASVPAPEWAPWMEVLHLRVERPADARVVGTAVAAGLALDLAVRSGFALAGTLLVVVVAIGLLSSGRLQTTQSKALVALTPLFGMWFSIRMSPWLLPLDVLAVIVLLGTAASVARGGDVFDLSVPDLAERAIRAVAHAAAAPPFLLSPLTRGAGRFAGARGHTVRAVLRGVLIALPILVVLGVLLASADPVFGSLFSLDLRVDATSLAIHVFAITVGAWATAGLLRTASAEGSPPLPQVAWRLGRVETFTILGALVALFAAFAAAQVVVLAGGARHVIDTAGLTYAEYARSGFFQLIAVALITLAVLLALRAVADLGDARVHRAFTVVGEVAVALTLVIVAVAIRRMDLYERAFSLTMLRLYVKVFSLWIGVTFVLLGLSLAGVARSRTWFPAAAVASALAFLLAMNVSNPEAIVVRHNVTFAERGGRFDAGYVSTLSEDAIPTLVRSLPKLPSVARQQVLAALCPIPPRQWHGWPAYNASTNAARATATAICASR